MAALDQCKGQTIGQSDMARDPENVFLLYFAGLEAQKGNNC